MDSLNKALKELKETLTRHGRPGLQPQTAARSAKLLQHKSGATATADSNGSGSYARVFVPDGVRPGDVLELKLSSRTVRVIVDETDAQLEPPRGIPPPPQQQPVESEAAGSMAPQFVMQQCNQ